MMQLGKATLVLCAVLVLATGGCGGGSKADKAAQDLLNILQDGNKHKSDPAKALEVIGKAAQASQTLAEEVQKMTPEEQKAFQAKWEKKFKAAGQSMGQ